MGWVYFIQGTISKNIKIGHTTKTMRQRLRGIQSSDPLVVLKTIPGTKEDESRLHIAFRDAHSHREWFRPTEALLAYINSLPDNQDTGIKQSWSLGRWRLKRMAPALASVAVPGFGCRVRSYAPLNSTPEIACTNSFVDHSGFPTPEPIHFPL